MDKLVTTFSVTDNDKVTVVAAGTETQHIHCSCPPNAFFTHGGQLNHTGCEVYYEEARVAMGKA